MSERPDDSGWKKRLEWRAPGGGGEAGGQEVGPEVSLLFRRRWDVFQILFVYEQLEREVVQAMTQPSPIEELMVMGLRVEGRRIRAMVERSEAAHPALSKDRLTRSSYNASARGFQRALRQCEQRIRKRGHTYRRGG